MRLEEYAYVWLDGKIVEYENAKVPLMTHALHYGTSVIEGIRAYKAKDNLYIFRLEDHIKRLFRSASIHSIPLRHSVKDVIDGVVQMLRKNDVRDSCYIRPIAFVGLHGIDLYVREDSPSHIAIVAFKFDQYFNSNGIRACISSWRRINDLSLPPLAKAGANYLNSVLATQECRRRGYDEAILLDSNGMVSEAPGENVFLVRNGRIVTPSLASCVLEGITRDTAMRIARDMGYVVEERNIPRSELYVADEVFLTGTAAEITPVISIDDHIVGDGKEGKVTRSIREIYAKTVRAEVKAYMDWLTPVW
ncbi:MULTISPECIES: branched-chain amino acid transaminase [Candidatus Nitrosocaldus]|jgi:branched-chain amino acid aminotransferase|uniref:Branched-chain-amino-acid aminotransferase n=1 Tax=Candidatus Nitrosocaldus cavascurensis TaxID=2058097 RepID=A0A2K5AQW5_9ARCH|nr:MULTISPECIES: branched-chain amino acid transaminase [Candidatus Nitrosocaldus]SPC34043.1 putative branched-chain-amino-acid aminotransferase [Candidatus Nitrosocaldus cavascurensis]